MVAVAVAHCCFLEADWPCHANRRVREIYECGSFVGIFAPMGVHTVDVVYVGTGGLVAVADAFWYEYRLVFINLQRDNFAKSVAFAQINIGNKNSAGNYRNIFVPWFG